MISFDDVLDLETEQLGKDPVRAGRRLQERVDQLISWAEGEEYELDETVSRGYLLSAAAEHLADLGELDRALELASRAAEAATGDERFEAYPGLIAIRLARGERQEALALADEVRRAQLDDALLVERLAEEFEHAGELQLAERWFVIALRRAEQTGIATDDAVRSMALSGRFRVRRDAGKPIDVLDAETQRRREALGQPPLA